jgi:L-fuconolactonase
VTARIDAHHHVWRLGARAHGWLDEPALAPLRRDFTLDDLAPQAAAAGVGGTVLVQVLADIDETREFLALAGGSDLVAGVVGWADLTSSRVADDLAALRAGPGGDRLVGVRHLVQGETDPAWLTRADVGRGLAAVDAAGLAYDLLTLPHQLPAAVAAARAHPEVTFVLDHLSKPPIAADGREPWALDLRRLAAEDNVVAKLSGLVTEAAHASWTVDDLRPYADIALDAFGPARLMFGSDWPVCLLAAGYAEVVAAAEALVAGLSPAERADVFAETARRAYGLPHPVDLGVGQR